VPNVAVTKDLVEELHRDAARIVAHAVHAGSAPPNTTRLEPTAVISLVALKILVPIIVSVASGLSLDEIRQRRANARTATKLRTLVNETVGRPLQRMQSESRGEVLDLTVADLEAAGAAPHAARAAAERILSSIEARIAKSASGDPEPLAG
jgi:hypothetical protein